MASETIKNVTSKEFADALWEAMRKASRKCYEDLCEFAANQDTAIKLNDTDEVILSRELIIAHLWAISKALSPDTKVLDAIHERYFVGHYNSGETKSEKAQLANTAQVELSERYALYYKAWEADQTSHDKKVLGTAISYEMQQFLFPRFKAVLDFRLSILIQADIYSFIRTVLEVRKKYAIND